ncbi:MAG TPA: D-alanine--D-alanine ligase [Acidiferrobacteraceae bacterium]|nr:D-alanine--D-alanine ligase [Acidiferrobacteraceae bacterium]
MGARDYGRVAVLYGGVSTEREVSLKSGAAVLAALQASGIDAQGLDADRSLPERLQAGRFDRVFIALHGRYGEDGVVQGLLEWLGIPYTGSRVLASALGMDKLRSKWVLKAAGIPVAEHVILTRPEDCRIAEARLGLPAIVKPAREGSSIGVSKVRRTEDWDAAWHEAARFGGPVFAEAFIDGPELTAAVLGTRILPLVRLETTHEFYDYDAKYLSNTTRYLCPAGMDPQLEAHMQGYARQTFEALGAAGWGRVDFMVDKQGRPYVLEINTVPGMTDHSLVPMAAKAAGIDFGQLCQMILDTSFTGVPA